jgi:hypothetical protein
MRLHARQIPKSFPVDQPLRKTIIIDIDEAPKIGGQGEKEKKYIEEPHLLPCADETRRKNMQIGIARILTNRFEQWRRDELLR